MDLGELEQIVATGESATAEFKATTGQRTDGAKTICGMLNAKGGFVFFGVRDDGSITGQAVTSKTLGALVQEIRRIEPRPLLEPETVRLSNGRSVIVVRVPRGITDGPYTYDGRPYLRAGPTTEVMTQQQYKGLLTERTHHTHRWEIQPAHRSSVDDLDHSEILRTVIEGIRRGRLDDPGTRDPVRILNGLGLMMDDGQLLNAGVVLFGRADRLLPYYPQCLLRMARFRGIDKTEFADNRQEVGHAFDLLQRAQRFLRDQLPVAGRIVPNLFEREDDPAYPLEALREALANAICHRDYAEGGGSVSLGVYDDRLEIASVGGLHFGLTVDDLTKPHVSRPWNPLIAKVFYLRGIIETWGRGTIRMAELTQRAGLVPPEFEEHAGALIVRFRPSSYLPPSRISHDLSQLQRNLLKVLAEIGPAPLSEIMASLPGRTVQGTIQDNLQLLRRLGLVDLRGQRRWAKWKLTDSAGGLAVQALKGS